ncbi:MAG: carbonic anhydrase [Verrucomicrobiota bacterium]
MQTIKSSAIIALLVLAGSAFTSAEPADANAWKQLLDGNARFVSGRSTHPHQDGQRRAELAVGQKPFAVVIGCADSRTSPEILFDQGLGDLFVVRLAGNIVDDAALGSVEYAVEHLGARLIVVLGHEKCGAVKATVGVVNGDPAPGGHIGSIVEAIKPAVQAAKGKEGDAVENAMRENVHEVVGKLKIAAPVLGPLVKSGELKVVGARYDLDDGKVEIVP